MYIAIDILRSIYSTFSISTEINLSMLQCYTLRGISISISITKKIICHFPIVLGWMHTLAERLKYSNISEITNVEAYVTALYYTFTSLTSVGFGNVNANTSAEKVFTIVMMLIGGK